MVPQVFPSPLIHSPTRARTLARTHAHTCAGFFSFKGGEGRGDGAEDDNDDNNGDDDDDDEEEEEAREETPE